jgi:hypothetical protein
VLSSWESRRLRFSSPAAVADRQPGVASENAAAQPKFAQCVQAHGEPNYPEPGGNTEAYAKDILKLDPNSPQFRAATKACKQYLPKGAPVSPCEQEKVESEALTYAQLHAAARHAELAGPTLEWSRLHGRSCWCCRDITRLPEGFEGLQKVIAEWLMCWHRARATKDPGVSPTGRLAGESMLVGTLHAGEVASPEPPTQVAWVSSRGPEFEQRVALRFVEVILWRVIDAHPVSA